MNAMHGSRGMCYLRHLRSSLLQIEPITYMRKIPYSKNCDKMNELNQ